MGTRDALGLKDAILGYVCFYVVGYRIVGLVYRGSVKSDSTQ
jgi:hypothetical protein